PAATRPPRSQPLPGRTGLGLQHGMHPTLPIAALLSSIPGARPREKARDGSRDACDRPDPTNITRQSLGSLKSHRAELASGEILQGAEACVEFGGRQAPQAVERAQKIPGRTVALARVAFETAGNQVAVGIASQAHAWHHVVEAVYVSWSAAEAVKARAALA